MEPSTTLIRNWLLSLKDGASPLRSPISPPTAPSAPTTTSNARKGKGKGSSKGKGKSKNSNGDGIEEKSSAAAASASKQAEEEEVEGEFFSRGRKGQGNRRNTRASPELSQVVTHNLVVLLSALHRVSLDVVSGDGVGVNVFASAVAGITIGGQGGKWEGGGDESARLAREQEVVFGLAEPLLDACLKVAAKRASPQLFGTVVETKAMLRRRLWSSEDPSAIERQQKEADVELDAAVPSVKVRLSVFRYS